MENNLNVNKRMLNMNTEGKISTVSLTKKTEHFKDTILSASNSIEVEAFLEDNFEENSLSKQIIVERIDDFIEDEQFGELDVDSSNSLQHEEYDSKSNITIVPNVYDNSDAETHIISGHDKETDDVCSTLFHDNQNLEVYKNDISFQPETDSNKRTLLRKDQVEFSDHLSMQKESFTNSPERQTSKGRNSKRISREKQHIRIDKNDPRSRIHFVKYMKKDGKIIKLWECGICEKEFIHQYTLTRHLPTHTDERNYKCKHCGKAFRQMSTLAQHKATHSQFRPYVCDICEKTFSRVSTLISHKKIHTEVKPHVCHICGKGFHQKGNLKNHFFTHTNERPYKCDVCGKGFNQASNLQCHKLKAHLQKGSTPQLVNNKYSCQHCPETFARRAQLRQHEEYIHDIRNVFSSKNSLKPNLTPARIPLLRKKKMGSIRIIQIPPGGEGDADKLRESDVNSSTSATMMNNAGILIDPIDTEAMHKALSKGNIPFALLKPAQSSPVVVKVQLCDGSKHMLVPASAAELKETGKFSVSSEEGGNRTVQIKVPVVATIHQRVDESGEIHMDVEPPSDEEPEEKFGRKIDKEGSARIEEECSQLNENRNLPTEPIQDESTIVQHYIINPSFIKPLKENQLPEEEAETEEEEEEEEGEEGGSGELSNISLGVSADETFEYILPSQVESQLIEIAPPPQQSPVDLLATAVNLTNDTSLKEVEPNVQYLRPTENLGEYEVIGPDENALFEGSSGVIQHLKPLLDESEGVTVDQSHLTAFMNALQTAGYEFHTDEGSETHQIILNGVDEAIIVDDQIVMKTDVELSPVDDVEGVSVEEENQERTNSTLPFKNSRASYRKS